MKVPTEVHAYITQPSGLTKFIHVEVTLYKRNECMSIKQATHAHHKCWLDTTDSKST